MGFVAAMSLEAQPSVSSFRPRCERCLRPASHCLCAHVRTVANRTHVLILQHPTEYRHALNTGRLAALGLQRSQIMVGENFPQLEAMVADSTKAVHLPFNYPQIFVLRFMPSATSANRDMPRQITVLPGGGSLERAR